MRTAGLPEARTGSLAPPTGWAGSVYDRAIPGVPMLTRRRLLQTSAAVSAAVTTSALLPGCGPEAADGTLARPFTKEDPGPWADKVDGHTPVVYAGLVDESRVRLWVE